MFLIIFICIENNLKCTNNCLNYTYYRNSTNFISKIISPIFGNKNYTIFVRVIIRRLCRIGRKRRSTNLRESLSQAEHRNDISGGARKQLFFFFGDDMFTCINSMANQSGHVCLLSREPAVRRQCNCLFKVKPT